MNEFPVTTTTRLIPDKPIESDIPRIVKFAGNSKVADTTQNIPDPYRQEDAIVRINKSNRSMVNTG